MQRINAARSEEIASGYEDGSLVQVDDDLLEQEPDLIPTKVKTSRADNPDDEVELLRVDGKDVWVKKAQIFDTGKRSLQKEIAADKRLEEVAGREANVRAKETELARMEAELLGRSSRVPDVQPDDAGREFAQAVFTDEEKVAKTITGLFQGLAEVKAELRQTKAEKDTERARETSSVAEYYHKNFPSIAGDQGLHQWFNEKFISLVRENPSADKKTIVNQAAESALQRVRDVAQKALGITIPTAGKRQPTVPQGNTRMAAKERMPAPIRSASSRREPAPDEPPPKTTQEVIDQQRRGRGPSNY